MKKRIIVMSMLFCFGIACDATQSESSFFVFDAQPGLEGVRISGTSSTTTSLDSGVKLGIFLCPPQIYNIEADMPTTTTFSYSGYMWLEAGTYTFKGNIDDAAAVRIDGRWLFTKQGSANFIAEKSCWYPVDFRVANGSGPGGLYDTSTQFGILWKGSDESEWHKVEDAGDGSRFCVPVSPGIPHVPVVNLKTWENRTLSGECLFSSESVACELLMCYSVADQALDTNLWTRVSLGDVANGEQSKPFSVELPEGATCFRFCTVNSAGIHWSKSYDVSKVDRPVFVDSEFNKRGSTTANFIVEVESIGANASSVSFSVRYGLSKICLDQSKLLGTVTSPGTVSNAVENLAFDTKYWYRIVAENDKGLVVEGELKKLEIVRNWSYSLSGGNATVTGLPSNAPKTLVIPEVIDGYPVTGMSFGYKAFGNQTRLVIPASITTIDGNNNTFGFHSNLTIDWYVSPDIKTVNNIFHNYGDRSYGNINIYAYGPYPNGFPGITAAFRNLWCVPEVAASWFANVSKTLFRGYLDPDEQSIPEPTAVKIISAGMRANDPTIMDVVYRVESENPTVKVRALAFKNGSVSFANVLVPQTYADGTASNIGDAIEPNVPHKLSWHVAADWDTDLSKVSFQVLAQTENPIKLELTTLPAHDGFPSMTFSWNALTSGQLLNALYWYYAAGDGELSLTSGKLYYSGKCIANGNSLSDSVTAAAYVFRKMGYEVLSGNDLAHVNSMTELGLSPSGARQYAVRKMTE